MAEQEWSESNEFRGGNDRIHDAPIATEKVIIDRKVFFLDLKENARGRFM